MRPAPPFARFAALSPAVLAALLACAAGPAAAQGYPAKPVRVVVAFGAGGAVDILARIVGQKLGEAWGQPVVVENRAGAAGNIATETVARSPADGHTLLFHTSAIALNASLYAKLPFDTAKDLAPIMKVASTNAVFIVPMSLPARSVKEVVALAKSQPGKLAFASTGVGSSSHLFMALFMDLAGIELVHVPYKNISQMYSDFIPGRTHAAITTVPSALPHIQAGKVRALAVTSSQRADSLREVPTMQEAGFASYEASTWYGAFAPAGTPAALIQRINADLQNALALGEVKQRFAAAGLEPQGGSAGEFAKHFQQEIAKWAQVVKNSGIQAE